MKLTELQHLNCEDPFFTFETPTEYGDKSIVWFRGDYSRKDHAYRCENIITGEKKLVDFRTPVNADHKAVYAGGLFIKKLIKEQQFKEQQLKNTAQ